MRLVHQLYIKNNTF